MKDFILLMHNDAAKSGGDWESYLKSLRERDVFDGGSSIGAGTAFRKFGPAEISGTLRGYIRVRAESLEEAKIYLKGNPVYENGGTVEIRELLRD
ncbi:MAG: hypothetical protein JSR55_04240 [Proteobacteria bacterium]|nr:hypothetical protein [Pseudomonadota bacterium]